MRRHFEFTESKSGIIYIINTYSREILDHNRIKYHRNFFYRRKASRIRSVDLYDTQTQIHKVVKAEKGVDESRRNRTLLVKFTAEEKTTVGLTLTRLPI